LAGGYPEVQGKSLERSNAWFKAYISSVLQRELRELSDIEGLDTLPGLLALLASRAGSLLNTSDLSRSLNIPNATLIRYLRLLEAVYLTMRLPPWYKNIGKRLVKAPRIYLNDTGLLCQLLGFDAQYLALNRQPLGSILENFVIMELMKQSIWSKASVRLYHYRTHTGQEVDIILEKGINIVGIEVKAASTITQEDFKGLRHLSDELGKNFHRGIVLYTGNQTAAFGKNLWAVPISALWQAG
jgi:predicted AAA+ superfamily ATPase